MKPGDTDSTNSLAELLRAGYRRTLSAKPETDYPFLKRAESLQ
jgi:hypothetical protein